MKPLSSILDTKDDEIISDALWSWAYLTGMESFKIEDLAPFLPLDKLCNFLGCEKQLIVIPAVRLIGNLCFGSDQLIDALLDAGMLKVVAKILATESSTQILKGCTYMLYNVAAGPSRHIVKLIASGIVKSLCEIALSKHFEPEVCYSN